MKIYQISYRGRGVVNGEHRGYHYAASKKEAERLMRQNTNDQCGPDDIGEPIRVINIEISKRGTLSALNQYGGHPDNG